MITASEPLLPRLGGRGLVRLGFLLCVAATGCTDNPPDDTDTDTGTEDAPLRLDVVGFNVESGNSDSATVAELVSTVQGEALWGFNEVANETWLGVLSDAAADSGQTFDHVLGTTGYSLKLAAAWDTERVEVLSHWELHDINVGGTVRSPLVLHLRLRENDVELLFVVNHLWRGEWDSRQEQAEKLNDWALSQTLPILMVGDYNFDWEVDNGDTDHDAGYDLLTEGDVLVWVRPEILLPTQCSGYNSVLDFSFVGGDAREWAASAQILGAETWYCYEEDRSDHRPVAASFEVPGGYEITP